MDKNQQFIRKSLKLLNPIVNVYVLIFASNFVLVRLEPILILNSSLVEHFSLLSYFSI